MLVSPSRHALRDASVNLTRIPPSVQGFIASLTRHGASRLTQSRAASAISFANTSSRPYRSPPMTDYTNLKTQTTQAARYNLRLGYLVNNRRTAKAFEACAEMKRLGVQPDHTTYDLLLESCTDLAMYSEALAIFEDMVAKGFRPNELTFHHLLNAARLQPVEHVWMVWDTMLQYGIEPDERHYEYLITRLVNGGNLEMALQYLNEQGQKGKPVTFGTIRAVIQMACRFNQPRIALQLAQGFDQASVRRIDAPMWLDILSSSSEVFFMEGIQVAWAQTVDKGINPDEGSCLNVLHASGRFGLPELGMTVLQTLRNIGVPLEEYHFAPVVEAFVNAGNVSQALEALCLMRDSAVVPTLETAHPIFLAICQDIDKVDDAYSHLDVMHKDGKKVDINAFNVIIQAAVALGDLNRAFGMVSTAETLDVVPNIDTYNLLFSACVAARHRELGDRLISQMQAAKLKPDVRTYERIIVLCLTQPTYEDAFFYLEEMKTAKLKPTESIYEAIIRRCVSVGDTRYKLAVEEMQDQGYTPSEQLQAFISSGGKETAAPETKPFRSARNQSSPMPSPGSKGFRAALKEASEDERAGRAWNSRVDANGPRHDRTERGENNASWPSARPERSERRERRPGGGWSSARTEQPGRRERSGGRFDSQQGDGEQRSFKERRSEETKSGDAPATGTPPVWL